MNHVEAQEHEDGRREGPLATEEIPPSASGEASSGLRRIVTQARGVGSATVSRTLVLLGAFALVALSHFGPTLPGLSPQGQTVLGVFVWFMLCTATGSLPPAAVGIGAPMLVVVLDHAKLTSAFNAFEGNVFFLAFGAFVIAAVMMATPLGKRIALGITSLCRSSKVDRVMGGAMGATVFLHAVLPTVSETALFLPVAQGLTHIPLDRAHRDRAALTHQALILTVAGLTPLFAGSLFLTGAFPNLMLVAVLSHTAGIKINWLSWFVYNLPLWGLLPILFFYVRRWFRLSGVEFAAADVALPAMRAELGPLSWSEVWAVICVTAGFGLWVAGPWTGLSTGMVAIIVVLALFAPWGGLQFAEIGRHLMWEIWILLGGAISMGNLLYTSKDVGWMAKFIVTPIHAAGITQPVVILLIVVLGLHIARAGVVSAVAAGAAFIPLTIGLAKGFGLAILPFSLIVTNALSYAVFLPISITAVLIAFAASGMRWSAAMRLGGSLSLIANVYIVVAQSAWLDFLGFPLH